MRSGLKFALLALAAGCRGTPERPAEMQSTPPPRMTIEVRSVDGPHDLTHCLSDAAASYREAPDGILFFEKTSKLAVLPPRGPKVEPYHAHLLHRVDGKVVDHVVRQGEKGTVELDLSSIAEPEALVVASGTLKLAEQNAGETSPSAEGMAPPYALGFKLVAADQWEALVKLQPFRYEVETQQGTLYAFVQSFNRRDMLVSWLDPGKSLQALIQEDPYVHLKRVDGTLPPRLVAEVRTAAGVTWQRAGTWHMPEWIDRTGPEEPKPFVFRTPDRDLLSFAAPPRIDLELPKDPAATSAKLSARFTGVGTAETLKFVLACSYPTRGPNPFGARVQTHDVTAAKAEGQFTIALDHLDPGAFPLTSAVSHRFVHAWKFPGGLYRPVPPRDRVVLPAQAPKGPRRLPSNVVVPRYASHYDFLAFLGAAGARNRKTLSTSDAYEAGRRGLGNGPGTNLTPPPGPGVPVQPVTPPPPPDPSRPDAPDGGVPLLLLPVPLDPRPPDPKPPPGDLYLQDMLFTFPCPPAGKGCQMEKCTCDPHTWDPPTIDGTVRTAYSTGKPKPPQVKIDWVWTGRIPCHTTKHVAKCTVTYWGPNVAFRHIFFNINVAIEPCSGKPWIPPTDNGGTPVQPQPPIRIFQNMVPTVDPARPGVPTTVSVTGTTVGGPVTYTNTGVTVSPGFATSDPYNDPQLTVRGGIIDVALCGTGIVPIWAFGLTDPQLTSVLQGFGTSYNAHPQSAPATGGWNPNLPHTWGIYLNGSGGGLIPTQNGNPVQPGGSQSPGGGVAPGPVVIPPFPPPPT